MNILCDFGALSNIENLEFFYHQNVKLFFSLIMHTLAFE